MVCLRKINLIGIKVQATVIGKATLNIFIDKNILCMTSVQFSSVQSLSRVQLIATP